MAAASSVVMQPLAMPTLLSSGVVVPDAVVSDAAMVSFLRRCLLDTSMPVALRWRAILSLRNRKGAGSRQALCAALSDESSLLAHEAAFSLGQMQDPDSIPALRTTLKGIKDFHPIVRHEEINHNQKAAEALGAIGTPECLELLQEALVNDPAPEVRETCDLALHRIEQVQAEDLEESPFRTVDPAVAASSSSSVAEMRKKLLDEKEQLHERYAALFGLRNRGGTEAVAAIIASLQCESALLKHEVAYVLGQLQDKASTDALVSTLKDVTEHPMVRHEAAEALGAIAESCEVALHMLELEQQGKPFELRLGTDA